MCVYIYIYTWQEVAFNCIRLPLFDFFFLDGSFGVSAMNDPSTPRNGRRVHCHRHVEPRSVCLGVVPVPWGKTYTSNWGGSTMHWMVILGMVYSGLLQFIDGFTTQRPNVKPSITSIYDHWCTAVLLENWLRTVRLHPKRLSSLKLCLIFLIVIPLWNTLKGFCIPIPIFLQNNRIIRKLGTTISGFSILHYKLYTYIIIHTHTHRIHVHPQAAARASEQVLGQASSGQQGVHASIYACYSDIPCLRYKCN